MAKKSRQRAKVQRARSRARKLTKAPVAGPVTLDQARALALASLPAAKQRGKLAMRQSATPATPATVGIARKRLALQREREERQRIREYTATLAIMKQRGVKGLAQSPKKKVGKLAKAGAKSGPKPLQIFAEGDSWFKYPYPGFGGGIIPRLEKRLGVPILNLAKAGDEVRYMLGVEERTKLVEQFSRGCPAGGPWDVLLFSGGGNDIVDNPMALWIRDFDPNLSPAQQIHQQRLDAAMSLVRAGYEDLIELRDSLSPTTHLIFHCYDFAIPDGRGACHLGPWLEPTFKLRRFPTVLSGFEVTKVMLQQFAAMLTGLGSSHAGITVISKQGKLEPKTSSWHNELHPSDKGFNIFASVFYSRLKMLFPDRVL